VVKIARGPKGERIRLLHDACGRLIERIVDRDGFRPQRWTYAWDAHDRLVSSSFLNGASETETWTFTYDPFGRRITKVRQMRGHERGRAKLLWPQPEGRTDTPAVGTFFLWDGDQLTAEAPLHLGGHVEWGKAALWLYADEGSHTPIAKRLPDGAVVAIVADHLGTPKEMFDEKGNLVWAADHHVWGAVRSVRTSGALALKPSHDPHPAELHCPFRFPGQYEDAETGLYYNRHQHYDPLTGEYASPDPIGLAGGDRPQGYVANPGVWVDPLGLLATVARTGPVVRNELTTYSDFAKRSVVGDGLEGHEALQHAWLKSRGLAGQRLSTDASKSNPIIVLEKAFHKRVNAAQSGFDVTKQSAAEDIRANA
jgi:RHS repeat-associated protein